MQSCWPNLFASWSIIHLNFFSKWHVLCNWTSQWKSPKIYHWQRSYQWMKKNQSVSFEVCLKIGHFWHKIEFIYVWKIQINRGFDDYQTLWSFQIFPKKSKQEQLIMNWLLFWYFVLQLKIAGMSALLVNLVKQKIATRQPQKSHCWPKGGPQNISIAKNGKDDLLFVFEEGPLPKKLPMMNIKEEQQQQQQAPSILTYYSVNSFTLWGLLGVVIFARKLNNYPLSFFGYSYLNSKCKLLGKWGGICQCYCQPLLLTYIPMHVVGGWGAKRSLGY